MSVVLACDLGGTSFRAGLVDGTGVIRAEAHGRSPSASGPGGASEIDPDAWWGALAETAARLATAHPRLFGSIAAISICGVTRSQVLLGPAGDVLRPAMTWNDTRAAAIAADIAADLAATADQHTETVNMNAFHPLARLAWIRANEPDVFHRIACVLDPKDHLNFRLTGERASDAISLARLLASNRQEGGRDLFAACGIPARILPRILAPHEKVGAVQPAMPSPFDRLSGVPVFCCSNDTWAAAAGLGALRPGHAYNISGTTEVLGVMADGRASADGLLSVDWGGLWQLGGPSLNGADTMSWLAAVLGTPAAGMDGVVGALLSRPRQTQPLLFLPYLQGERVPFWNPSLRGAFLGLGRQHGAADLAHAVMEGIAYLNREVLERAETALGWQVGSIRFGGGGATNPAWCQIKADVCGRPVETCVASEPGVLGAAAVAWTGLGLFGSLAQAQDALVKVKARFEPDSGTAAHHAHMFALFRQASAALSPISQALATMPAKTSSAD